MVKKIIVSTAIAASLIFIAAINYVTTAAPKPPAPFTQRQTAAAAQVKADQQIVICQQAGVRIAKLYPVSISCEIQNSELTIHAPGVPAKVAGYIATLVHEEYSKAMLPSQITVVR